MKYCKKCGMLLEDTQNTCIGCGTDVSLEENISLYPPNMEQSIQTEKESAKKRTGIIAAIVAIFALLVALIVVLVVYVSSAEERAKTEKPEEVVEEVAETSAEPEEVVEEEEKTIGLNTDDVITNDTAVKPENKSNDNRTVKDDKGLYYDVHSVTDDAGTVVFTTVCPEDFVSIGFDIDYGKYSTKYPEVLTFMASNEDNSVKFTYISPQDFWFRDSENGKSRSNERDVIGYKTYYAYDGVQPYLEALIKASYKDIKKVEFKEKKPIDEGMEGVLKKVSDNYTKKLTGEIGDYAGIGEDTTYAAMAADHEACIYTYNVVSRQGNTVFMDFYIPVMANTLGYASESAADKGDVVDWSIPCIVVFEAGNEDLHEFYEEEFKAFIYNSRLTREFFYDNYEYSKVIEAAVKDEKAPDPLDKKMLEDFHKKYTANAEIGEYNEGISEFLSSTPAGSSKFKNGSVEFTLPSKNKVGFYDATGKKLFASEQPDEYPGNSFEELELTDPQ